MTRRQTSTPSDTLDRRTGYRMPGEWEPHEATWLAWPHFHGDWPGKFEPIPWVYAEIIRHLSRHERVELIVNNADSERRARQTLKLANAQNGNIRFHRWPTNRVWTRDSGCTFVTHGVGTNASSVRGKRGSAALQAIKWHFNAWAKYSNYRHDEKIGSLMASAVRAEETRAHHRGTRVVSEFIRSERIYGTMPVTMTSEFVSARMNVSHQLREFFRDPADKEKCSLHAIFIKDI